MIVSILQDNLIAALATAAKAVHPRPVLPIMANVLLEAEGQTLTITGYDLAKVIMVDVRANVAKAGKITVPAKTFSDFISRLPAERVDLAVDESTQTLKIVCGTIRTEIKGVTATEYPAVRRTTGAQVLELKADDFRTSLKEVLFAAAREDNRPILTGVDFRFTMNTLTLAAADGYNLSVKAMEIETTFGDPLELVIPAYALDHVVQEVTDETDTVLMELPNAERDEVIFVIGDVRIGVMLLEGRFPDYAVIIPASYDTEVRLPTESLLKACKRAEVFSRDSANSTRMYAKPSSDPAAAGELTVVGISAERGRSEEDIDASIDGEGVEFAVNVKYVVEALTALRQSEIALQLQGPAHPVVLRPAGETNPTVVVMPMSVNR